MKYKRFIIDIKYLKNFKLELIIYLNEQIIIKQIYDKDVKTETVEYIAKDYIDSITTSMQKKGIKCTSIKTILNLANLLVLKPSKHNGRKKMRMTVNTPLKRQLRSFIEVSGDSSTTSQIPLGMRIGQ